MAVTTINYGPDTPEREDIFAVLLDTDGSAWDGAAFSSWTDDDLPDIALQMSDADVAGQYELDVPSDAQEGTVAAAIYVLSGSNTYTQVGYGATSGTGETIPASSGRRLIILSSGRNSRRRGLISL